MKRQMDHSEINALMPENILPEVFYTNYDRGIHTLEQSGERFVYEMENETGTGIMTRYIVLPGIELLYNDIHMSTVHSLLIRSRLNRTIQSLICLKILLS